MTRQTVPRPEVDEEIRSLGPWFHNLHMPDGRQTAPEHWLGDFPRFKWEQIAPHLPSDIAGWSVLDVGCNAGFYSFQLARRGARVLGIDHDPRYLAQARWAACQMGLEDQVEFRRMQVYDLARWEGSFDLVWFMGVLYHLRYPLLALDVLSGLVGRMMVVQTFTLGGEQECDVPPDFSFEQRTCMQRPGWPKMGFIEGCMQGDPTNWWAPNDACVQAMLRSAGLETYARPGHEIYFCRPAGGLIPHPQMRQAELRAATGQGG